MRLQLGVQLQSEYPIATSINLQIVRETYGLLPKGLTLPKDRSVEPLSGSLSRMPANHAIWNADLTALPPYQTRSPAPMRRSAMWHTAGVRRSNPGDKARPSAASDERLVQRTPVHPQLAGDNHAPRPPAVIMDKVVRLPGR